MDILVEDTSASVRDEFFKLEAIQARTLHLAKSEQIWKDFATTERGFFVVESGATEALRGRYEIVRAKFIRGDDGVELKDVHEAFSDYAMSTRRNMFVRQLEGKAYDPIAKNSQAEIQRRFQADEINKVIRKTVTPQVEAQPDQLDRMRLYFGVDAYEYAVRKIIER